MPDQNTVVRANCDLHAGSGDLAVPVLGLCATCVGRGNPMLNRLRSAMPGYR